MYRYYSNIFKSKIIGLTAFPDCCKFKILILYASRQIGFIGVAWVFFLVRQLGECSEEGKLFLKWAHETHFPEFKWIIYDFNNNRNNTQKTFDMRQLVTIFGTSRQLWGELYLL